MSLNPATLAAALLNPQAMGIGGEMGPTTQTSQIAQPNAAPGMLGPGRRQGSVHPRLLAQLLQDPRMAQAQAVQKSAFSQPTTSPLIGLTQMLQQGLGGYMQGRVTKEYQDRSAALGEAQRKTYAALLAGDKQGALDAMSSTSDMADEFEKFSYAQYAQEATAKAKENEPYSLNPGEKRMRGDQVIAEAPALPEKPTDDMREYNAAVEQGFEGTLLDYQTALKRAGASSVTVPVNMGQKGFENELKLRSDFRSEPTYKAYQEVDSAYRQIKSGLGMQSPSGDLAAATKIMKLLDPTSVVRESELGMALQASGAMDRLLNYGSLLLSGEKLTPDMRSDFRLLADKLYSDASDQYDAKAEEYEGIASDYGMDAVRVVGRRNPRQRNDEGPATIADDAGYEALPAGAEFIAPDGTRRRKQ